jgi:hypothetical protein
MSRIGSGANSVEWQRFSGVSLLPSNAHNFGVLRS